MLRLADTQLLKAIRPMARLLQFGGEKGGGNRDRRRTKR